MLNSVHVKLIHSFGTKSKQSIISSMVKCSWGLAEFAGFIHESHGVAPCSEKEGST